MDKALYQVVLTGGFASGFKREAVLAGLARLFQTSAARLVEVMDGGEYPIDDVLSAEEAAELQRRVERLGALVRIDRVAANPAERRRSGLHLPLADDPAEAGLMRCPACGHQQLVAKRCDECGVVFAEFNRQRGATGSVDQRVAQRPLPQTPRVTPPHRPRDIHAYAHAKWREEWMDDGDELPTEQYHVNLFMGRNSAHLVDPCQRMMLSRRPRLMLSWAGGAVISPFLWAMYRKMWGWGLVIFVTEILLPVVLITLGGKEGVSDTLISLGIGLMAANRLFWPAIIKSLYCRHARLTVMYMNRMAPTYAPDIEIANRGGTSRTAMFVGVVLAIVASLLAWSIIDSLHAHWAAPTQTFTPVQSATQTGMPERRPDAAGSAAQNEELANENKWVSTRNRLRVLGQRLNAWFVDGGSSQDLTKMDLSAIALAVPLEPGSTLDGWDRPIVFRSDGQVFRLISAGPDGEMGNSDDIDYQRVLER